MIVKVNGENILNKILVILCCLLSSFAFAQEAEQKTFKQSIQQKDILSRFNALGKSTMKDFLEEMSKVNKISSEYIREREEECSGVYSTITTNEKGEQVEQKKKLSRKEKKLCKYLLVNFQVQITTIAFKLRKQYLRNLHRAQLIQLDELTKRRLAELESLAAKYK